MLLYQMKCIPYLLIKLKKIYKSLLSTTNLGKSIISLKIRDPGISSVSLELLVKFT